MIENNFKIGLIGFGNFGKLAASVLAKDFSVQVFDDANSKSKIKDAKKCGVSLADLDAVLDSDIIILSAPISQTEQIIKSIAKKIKPGALLMDVCSVKTYPCCWLKKYAPKNIEIIGTHPMFGPTTAKFDINKKSYILNDKQMILCPLRIRKERLAKIKKYLENLGIRVIIAKPEEHDRQNAKTLGLVHFIGRSLACVNVGEQEIFTPGYADLLRILPHTASDNWQLFYDMHNYNPFAEKLMEKYLAAGEHLQEKIIKARSQDEFAFRRALINRIDSRIFALLAKRFKHAEAIGRYKKKQGLKIIDRKREAEIINQRLQETDLDRRFVENIYEIIFKQAYKRQK